MGKDNKNTLNRREFIKKASMTAGIIGVSASMPGILRAEAPPRDYILIGRPLPLTGPVAAFTESSPWLDENTVAEINRDGGIYIRELGKKLPVRIKLVDTKSDPNFAAELASRLVLKDKVDLMYVSATPATVSPVASVCERFGVPCVSTMMPNEMFLHGGSYTWCFNASFSVRNFMGAFLQAWNAVKTNKVVALCAQNDSDGVAWAEGAQIGVESAGYKMIDHGRFPVGTNDYSSQINTWKKANVEILFANMAPPDFNSLWRQCYRNGFIPKVATAGRAGMFASVIEALGNDLGLGLTVEACWHPSFPFKSSLSGQTAQEFADSYEKTFNKQWTQPLGGLHSGYEILADVLNRAQTLDKEALRKAFYDTNLDTLQGPTKFMENNTATTPNGCLQWVKGDKHAFKAILVGNGKFENLPVNAKAKSIQELTA